MKFPLLNIDGSKNSSIEISDKIVKQKINYKLIKFVIDWQLNHAKPRLAKTKQRNQIKGSTKKIVAQKVLKNANDQCIFSNLEPSKYYIKAIIDSNKNSAWDPGIYLKKSKPEKTYHFREELDVRANWILRERMILD